jgi:hypothetical protein
VTQGGGHAAITPTTPTTIAVKIAATSMPWFKGWMPRLVPQWIRRRTGPDDTAAAGGLPNVEPPAPHGTELERERDQLREALFALSEATQAVNALLGCPPTERDRYAKEWFDSLAAGVETALRTSTTERYRASIWADREDAVNFDAVGLGKFKRTDLRMQKLERDGSIAGDAFGSATSETYCPDIHDPTCGWRQRGRKRPTYKSLFAVALLSLDDEKRWGVMTVDCNIKAGFSGADLQVARHFGELASLGELIWRRKEAT